MCSRANCPATGGRWEVINPYASTAWKLVQLCSSERLEEEARPSAEGMNCIWHLLMPRQCCHISHTEDAEQQIVQVKLATCVSPQRYLSNGVKLESLFQSSDPLHLPNPVVLWLDASASTTCSLCGAKYPLSWGLWREQFKNSLVPSFFPCHDSLLETSFIPVLSQCWVYEISVSQRPPALAKMVKQQRESHTPLSMPRDPFYYLLL